MHQGSISRAIEALADASEALVNARTGDRLFVESELYSAMRLLREAATHCECAIKLARVDFGVVSVSRSRDLASESQTFLERTRKAGL